MSRPWLIATGVAAILVLALLAGGGYTVVRYKTYYGQSEAMMPAMHPRQMFTVDRFAYRDAPPRRGDVVVFMPPVESSNPFVQRVVAIPGDRFAIRGSSTFVNGKRVDEPYAPEKPVYDLVVRDYAIWVDNARLDDDLGMIPPRTKWTAADTVPPGCYVILGDNRLNAMDSHAFGFFCPGQPVPNKPNIHPELVGRALVR